METKEELELILTKEEIEYKSLQVDYKMVEDNKIEIEQLIKDTEELLPRELIAKLNGFYCTKHKIDKTLRGISDDMYASEMSLNQLKFKIAKETKEEK